MVGRWRDADCASPSLQVTPITDRLGNRKTQGAEAREKEKEKEKEKEREMERERERERERESAASMNAPLWHAPKHPPWGSNPRPQG